MGKKALLGGENIRNKNGDISTGRGNIPKQIKGTL
jgi:hypothetical protein